MPSAEPEKREPEESAGEPVGSDGLGATEVPPPPHTCSICGYYTNGGEVLCSAATAEGPQCPSCELPVAFILSPGDVDINMVVSGAMPPTDSGSQYDVTALSLLRTGEGRSYVARRSAALDVARALEDEGGGHIKNYRV